MLELADQPLALPGAVDTGEEVKWAEILVVHFPTDHEQSGDEHAVADRDERALLAAAVRRPAVLRLEVGVVRAGRRRRGLAERGAEPGVTLARAPGEVLARGLVVAWADPGPGRQVGGSGKSGHVRPDLRDDRLGSPLVDAGHRVQPVDHPWNGWISLSIWVLTVVTVASRPSMRASMVRHRNA